MLSYDDFTTLKTPYFNQFIGKQVQSELAELTENRLQFYRLVENASFVLMLVDPELHKLVSVDPDGFHT